VTVDWAVRETVRARLHVMVKTLLKRYKYPPGKQEEATENVLKQAESLSAEWVAEGSRHTLSSIRVAGSRVAGSVTGISGGVTRISWEQRTSE